MEQVGKKNETSKKTKTPKLAKEETLAQLAGDVFLPVAILLAGRWWRTP